MSNCLTFLILLIQSASIWTLDNHLETPIRFLAVGDWGGISQPPYSTLEQNLVAAQMQKFSENQKVSFILSLGDNFYPNGIQPGQTETRFNGTFEQVYLKGQMKHIPWYVIAGNTFKR